MGLVVVERLTHGVVEAFSGLLSGAETVFYCDGEDAAVPAGRNWKRLVEVGRFDQQDVYERSYEWATEIVEGCVFKGRPLPLEFKIYVKKSLQAELQDRVAAYWLPLRDLLEQRRTSPGKLTIITESLLFRSAANWLASDVGADVDCRTIPSQRGQLSRALLSRAGTLARMVAAAVTPMFGLGMWGKKESGDKRTVLFFLSQQVHWDILRRSVEFLERDGYTVRFVNYFGGYLDGPPENAQFQMDRVEDVFGFLRSYVHWKNNPAILRAGVLPEVFAESEAFLNGRLSSIYRRWLRHVSAFESVLTRVEPACVVTMDRGPMGCALAESARRRKVPSLNVAHGLVTEQNPSVRDLPYDAYAVFGEASADMVRRAGKLTEQCVPVPIGACRYDDIAHGDFPNAAAIRGELDVPATFGTVVLFASQWLLKALPEYERWKRETLRVLCRSLPEGAILICKKHPVERDRIVDEVMAVELDPSRYRIVDDRVSLYGLLAAADVITTMWSSVGCEAACLGKPVITINVTGERDRAPFSGEGIGLTVTNESEFRHAVRRVLEDKETVSWLAHNREKFIRKYLFANDGRASERLCRLIEHLCNGKPAGSFDPMVFSGTLQGN